MNFPKNIYTKLDLPFLLTGVKMRYLVKIIGGLMFMIAGIYTYVRWDFFGTQLINVIKLFVGNVGAVAILIGLVMFLMGLNERKENEDFDFEEEMEEDIEEVEEIIEEEKPTKK